jgi:hypothetical protein
MPSLLPQLNCSVHVLLRNSRVSAKRQARPESPPDDDEQEKEYPIDRDIFGVCYFIHS